MQRTFLSFLLIFGTFTFLNAEVRLPQMVSDGMVLQRNETVKIWGFADADEAVKITFQHKTYTTQADANGNWMVMLPQMTAGGPYKMTINNIILHDILVGDVFLCSGQSNMELPVRRVTDMFSDEIAQYSNDKIRHIKVPRAYDFHAPIKDIQPTSWKRLTPENALDFSALAYFFAKELFALTGIPVGIVNSSVGGSPVEAWMCEEALKPFPKAWNDLRMCQNDAYVKTEKNMEVERNRVWNATLYSAPLLQSEWRPIEIFSKNWANFADDTWATDGMNPINGSHYFRHTVNLTAAQASADATLRLGCIVDADSTFVNGVYVGNVTYQYPPRIYNVPKNILKTGENVIEIHLVSYSGTPHFVPEKPYKLITSEGEISLLDGWQYKAGVRMPALQSGVTFHYKPAGLYNGMIAPLVNYVFCGVIWYQGESNVSNRSEYPALLSAMINDWRSKMQQSQLPFYVIELAGFLHPSDIGGQKAWAEMRAEQAKVAKQNLYVSFIQNSDLGEWNDIHPLDKKTPAKRIVDKINIKH